ncbi:MAG TPA: hypothetical protein VFF27_05495 [Bacteroidia bacterium]|jgi:hypothetical protein|nr:hypothetical protein [Bacteroidia bacterium]
MEKKDFKEYKTVSFWKEKDEDIVFFKYAPQLEINIDTAKEIVKSRLEYTKGEQVYTLIDFTNVKLVTKEGREYMNDSEGGLKGILGGAFLSNSLVTTLFINLYLSINKPSVPAKFFTKKEDALTWLKGLKVPAK